MEGLLRKIIQQAESKLNIINWAEFEVPQIPKIAPVLQPPKPMVIEPVAPPPVPQQVKVDIREYKQPQVPELRAIPKDPKKSV